MPYTPSTLKAQIDTDITNKTVPYSISNVDVGNDMKAIIDLMVSLFAPIVATSILFTNQTSVVIPWNSTMIANYGPGGEFVVEILGDDGKYRQTPGVEIIPDSITSTTQYTINLGASCSGRILVK